MSLFDSRLELEILFDDLVDGFIKQGRSYDWIQDTLTGLVEYAIDDHKSDNEVDEWKDHSTF